MEFALSKFVPESTVGVGSIEDLYLSHRLHEKGSENEPYVFSNFIVSLDGRISVPRNMASEQKTVPGQNKNKHDLKLFKQLVAQADVVITASKHLRDVKRFNEPDDLVLNGQEDCNLINWRLDNSMKEKASMVVLSESLDLPSLVELPCNGHEVYVATWNRSDKAKIAKLKSLGYKVMIGEGNSLNVNELVSMLKTKKFKSIYSAAGPVVFSELLKAGLLSRLYLTVTQQMLGGNNFDTLTTGDIFSCPVKFKISELYFDPRFPANAGQLFMVFDRAGTEP